MHKKREMGTVAADAALQTRDGEEHPQTVFVLTIKSNEGRISNECFSAMWKAVNRVREEFKRNGVEDYLNFVSEESFRRSRVCTDGYALYIIDECKVN